MLSVHASPTSAQGPLMETGAAQRLVSGDSLGQAMFGSALLASVIADARTLGATSLELESAAAGTVHDDMAEAQGLALGRELLRMQCDLPIDEPFAIEVRPFRVGEDEA